MADPSTIALVSSLTLTLVKAWSDDDFELDSDAWAALREFVSTAPKLVDMFGREADDDVGATVTKLSVQAFREALRRHWAGSKLLVPGRVRFWQRWSQQYKRSEEIRACIETALDLLAQPIPKRYPDSEDLDQFPWRLFKDLTARDHLPDPPRDRLPDLCLDQPELSPIYLCLLAAFEKHGRELDPPLLDIQSGRRVEFDRQYRAVWKQLLTRGAGAQSARWLEAVADHRRREVVQDLLLGGLADWSEGHVFAAHEEIPDLPWMPPEDFYVEPRGCLRGHSAPLCELIESSLDRHTEVLVTADFGYGKSLTARTLAARWAQARLQDGPMKRSPLPIYVPCGALDWSDERTKIKRLIRRAWRQQLLDFTGEKIAEDDPALEPPTPRERTWIILDGLDEIRLSAVGLRRLLERIKSSASSSGYRFLLFCRPGLLSTFGDMNDVAQIHIEPFDEGNIDLWLRKWNFVHDAPGLTRIELEPIAQLIGVPILLFMAAYQWHRTGGVLIEDQFALYEQFAVTLAKGKLEATGEDSPRVRETARSLAHRLRDTLVVLREQAVVTDLDDEVAALLWLMGRVGWLGYRQYGDPRVGISEKDIDHVLLDLGVERDEQVDFHRVSLLTCMQGRLDGAAGDRYLFFGHRSFHEFFVARFWRDVLVQLCCEQPDEVQIANLLLMGELIAVGPSDDKALEFLLGLLARLSHEQRTSITEWARQIVNGRAPNPELKLHDRWHILQLVALAIYCELASAPELAPGKLRAILAKMWEFRRWRPLYVPGLRIRDADFSLADLDGSNFRRCHLEGAKFENTKLPHLCFDDANLARAEFTFLAVEPVLWSMGVPHTVLVFDGTILTHAQIIMDKLGVLILGRSAPVQASHLKTYYGAVLEAAHGDLSSAEFHKVVFHDVKASANLENTFFHQCFFDGCDFSAVTLINTRFRECTHRNSVWPEGWNQPKTPQIEPFPSVSPDDERVEHSSGSGSDFTDP